MAAGLAFFGLSSALTSPERLVRPSAVLTSRRAALAGLAALPAAALLPAPSTALASAAPSSALLEAAAWMPMRGFVSGEGVALYSDAFVMYMARLFVAFDATAAAWYSAERGKVPPSWSDERASAYLLGRLGALGSSLRYGLRSAGSGAELWAKLHAAWADTPGAVAQLALLFSLLAAEQQPVEEMRSALRAPPPPGVAAAAGGAFDAAAVIARLAAAPDGLLPPSVVPQLDKSTGRYTLPAPLRAPGVFGTVGQKSITRERQLGGGEYGLFALSGALGCALTHSLVVPLDVVKTRIQTRPGQYAGFGDAFNTIRREEGPAMLLQGLGATVAGYFLYGVSVYPGYEFFKRLAFELAGPQGVLEFRVPLVLGAGAVATIFTCFLITPFEAVRIRMVERPDFAPSLPAALKRYVEESSLLSLYDGLPPLMVRQVLFGMVKFLIFDFCSDAILATLPVEARSTLAVSLGVALLSGAIAGVAAAIVSQPADVLLTRIARGADCPEGVADCQGALPGQVNQLQLLKQEALVVYRQFGIEGFFLGLGSRCLWSGAIIAGQFFLYDVFKGAFKVTVADLTQFLDMLSAYGVQ